MFKQQKLEINPYIGQSEKRKLETREKWKQTLGLRLWGV